MPPRTEWICGTAVFAFSLGLYYWTLAPTVTLVDSGELIVAARTLGVAHPPGFPLYLLLAHLAALIPLGSVAVRVNFASALFAALASATLTLAVFEALSFLPVKRQARLEAADRKRKRPSTILRKAEAGRQDAPRGATAVPALAAGLLFCCSRTLWAYATIAEVYTLNTWLIALIFYLMLRWRRLVLEQRRQAGNRGAGVAACRPDRLLNAAALVFGLALGVHHVTVGLALPAFGVLVLATEGRKFFAGRRLLVAAAYACAGACVYLYLPLAASHAPLLNWGDPRTLSRFFAHITGWQYRVFLEARPELMGRQFTDFCALAAREFGPVWFPLGLALAAAGMGFAWRRAGGLFWLLLAALAANLAYNVNYEIAEDKDAYYLPVFLVLAIAVSLGLRFALEAVRKKSRHGVRLERAVATALLLLVPAVAIFSNYAYDNRRNYFIAHDYVSNILSTVEPGGMLLTMDWQVYSPMFYRCEIEGFRRDVVVIDINQLRRSWYFDYLERAYPETMNRARAEVDFFLEDLRHWERDPSLFQIDVALNRRISERFRDLILALAAGHLHVGPVYVTQDIVTYPPGGPDADWGQRIQQQYQLVPEGLVFRLFGDRQFHEPAHPVLATRGLTDGTLHFPGDDVVKVKVLPVYAGMSFNRGRYLEASGRHAEAAAAFEEALAFDPQFAAARQALEQSRSALAGN